MPVSKKSEETVKKTNDLTLADKIWEGIKNMKIDVFALSDQKIADYCKRIDVLPDQLFLKVKAGAVVVALEDTLRSQGGNLGILKEHEKFEVETDAQFTKIKVSSIY